MPPRRPTRPTPPDVAHLRAALGQGKLVRVGIAPSDQFPDGVTGRVRRIGDPAVDGDEYIFVEVPVGGAKDVLPFAADDLTGPPVRKRIAASSEPGTAKTVRPKVSATSPFSAAARNRPERPPSAAVSPAATPATRIVAASSAPATRTAPAPSAPATRTAPTQSAPASGIVPATSSTTPSSTPPNSAGGQPVRPVAPSTSAPSSRATAAARGKRPPVSITISTAGDESASWRIEAKI